MGQVGSGGNVSFLFFFHTTDPVSLSVPKGKPSHLAEQEGKLTRGFQKLLNSNKKYPFPSSFLSSRGWGELQRLQLFFSVIFTGALFSIPNTLLVPAETCLALLTPLPPSYTPSHRVRPARAKATSLSRVSTILRVP